MNIKISFSKKLPEETLIAKLREKNLTVSFAESCTGGFLAKRITDIPGSSDVFPGGVVSYSNELKMKFLGVSSDTLDAFGAVSMQTAREMALGICKQTGSDIGVGITGIAGPGGGSPEKPVGLVFVGICVPGKVRVFKLSLGKYKTRSRIRFEVTEKVLNLLLHTVDEQF